MSVKKSAIKSLLVLILSIYSISPFYGQSVLTGSSAKASCCGQGGNHPIPCNPLPILQEGVTYLIYINFTLSAPRNKELNFIDFDLDIIPPDPDIDLPIDPDSLKFFHVNNGVLGNEVANFESLGRAGSKDYVAFTYFKFSEQGNPNIPFGRYTFRVKANGFIVDPFGLVLSGTPFNDSTDSYFDVVFFDSGAPCPDTPLEDISNSALRTSPSPTLAPQWYPNPTQNSAILELDLKKDTNVDIEVMDMQGRVLLRPLANQNLKSGMNKRKLDVSQLAAGIYYTRITTDTETQVIKWVKLE